jgi:hypothetical protein
MRGPITFSFQGEQTMRNATLKSDATAINNVVKGSLSKQRRALRQKEKGKAADKAKAGTKVRHGIRQQSSLELGAIVQGARGDITKVTKADLRQKIVAMRQARADVAEAMTEGNVTRVMKLSTRYNAARSAARAALKDHASKRESLAITSLDVTLAHKVAAIVRSFAVIYSDDNETANRIGTFSDEEQSKVRAAFVHVLETVVPMCNRVANRNGYKA